MNKTKASATDSGIHHITNGHYDSILTGRTAQRGILSFAGTASQLLQHLKDITHIREVEVLQGRDKPVTELALQRMPQSKIRQLASILCSKVFIYSTLTK